MTELRQASGLASGLPRAQRPAVHRSRLAAPMALLVGGMVTVAAAPTPQPTVESFQDGRTAGVQLKNSSIVLSGNGVRGKSDGYRIPRPCWYEPSGKTTEEIISEKSRMPEFHLTGEDLDNFRKSITKFTDKVGKDGKEGTWWRLAMNFADPNSLNCWSGMEEYVWVPTGTRPAAGITARELLQIARAALTVPEPKIKLSPDQRSYVNLPTWLWLDGIGSTTRSVTATLPGVMSATVTAKLQSLVIKSGTTADRAEVRDACGPTGHPYVKGGTFTCGVRYLRASIDQPRQVYTLTVTTVWPVTTSTTGAGGAGSAPVTFAPVQVTASRDIAVGEVHSIVRS